MPIIFVKKKKIALISILCTISILFSSCGFFKPTAEKFDDFVNDLPKQFIANDSMDINYLFTDPESYGFKLEPLNLPFSSEEDNKKSMLETRILFGKLTKFKREELTEEQQITYDILFDTLDSSLSFDDYYLQASYLGSFIGFQSQLPLVLNNFNFERKNDLDSYFNILATTKETFLKYAELEKKRQEKGVGMSETVLKKVIEQCDNFIAEPRPFLIEEINTKIDTFSFLTDEEKTAAKAKNEKLLTEDFINGYKALGDSLREIKNPREDLGLSALPNGLEYYEALVRSSTGTDMTIDELKNYTIDRFNKYLAEFQKFAEENSSVMPFIAGGSMSYSEFKTVEENIDHLEKAVAMDYPPLPTLNYKVIPVPKSMEENFSPAAYFISTIDSTLEKEQVICLNGEFKESLFPTIAHEGYPGHMYQSTYAKALKLPAVRYMMSYGGYSEGWANYVENNSAKYAPLNPELLRGLELNQHIANMLVVLYDIGVHAEGWDRERFFEVYSADFNGTRENSDYMYDLILETPTNYMKYFIGGMQFEDLLEYAQEELGDKFSLVDFHKAVLSTNDAPFFVVKDQVSKYIDQTKGESVSSNTENASSSTESVPGDTESRAAA